MVKKVLIISSSPRRGANSDTLCDEFMRGAADAGNDVEKIFLRDKKINYCVACGTCFNLHKPCPQHDDADSIVQKMIDSDVIVLATPVYFYSMSAQMKTMIDRTCARYTEISNKDFYFIATMAEDARDMMERAFDALRGFTACLDGACEKGVIAATKVWQKGDIDNTPYIKEAYEMGKSV